MRFVVVGAGAVGGVVGGRLAEHGHDVVLIARGPHLAALQRHGLVVHSPDRRVTVDVAAVASPAEVDWREGDVVLLAVKGQDTAAAVHALALAAPPGVPVVCLQNGVENERVALRSFERVYGVCVMLPAVHLEAGVVVAHCAPTTGLLDIGPYPDRAVDDVSTAVAAAFCSSTFDSVARPDIMRWKYAKLLLNLANALEAACGPQARMGELAARARDEGVAVLHAAGMDVASDGEDRERRGALLRMRPVDGVRHGGGSSWQSLARGTGAIEADWLNGEVVLLGRLHGVPTPVNLLLQRVADRMAAEGTAPGSLVEADLEAELEGGHPAGWWVGR